MIMTEINQRITTTVEMNRYISSSTSNRHVYAVSKENEPAAKENLKGFLPLVGLAQVLGLLPIFLIIYWIFHYDRGLKLPTSRSINWHILLLCISLVYLNGNSIITFRLLRDKPKDTLKVIHASVGGTSCILAALGIWAAYPSGGFFAYYSLHSWIGICAVLVYIAQTIGGLYAFLYPGIEPKSRALLMPYHRFFGQILLVLSTMAVVTGINEKAMFKLQASYKQQPSEGMILNLAGILFVSFTVVVIYLASKVDYKRYPRLIDDRS